MAQTRQRFISFLTGYYDGRRVVVRYSKQIFLLPLVIRTYRVTATFMTRRY